MFKKLTRDTEYKKTQNELLDKKIIREMKNTLDQINGRLDITDEKMHELADTAIETII